MNKTLSKSERTRQFIIESTAETFNKKGYAGTSLTDLTKATGLTKGAIYCNFKNKQEVALAVFDYHFERLSNVLSEKVASAATFHDKLMVYAKGYRNLLREGPIQGGCPILNTAVDADDTNEPLRSKAAKAVLGWKNRILHIIDSGIKAGEFKQDLNKEKMAVSILALIEGGIMIAKVTRDSTNLDLVLKMVENIIGEMRI